MDKNDYENASNYCTINKNMTEAAYQNWIATYWIDSQRSTGSANPKNEKSPRFVLSSGRAIILVNNQLDI